MDMENIIVPAILLAGIIFAWRFTQWINWYSWGENRKNKEKKMRNMQGRGLETAKKEKPGKDELP